MTLVVLAGMGVGLCLFGLLRLLLPARPPLTVALARYDAARGGGRRPAGDPTVDALAAAPQSGWKRRLHAAEVLVGRQVAGRLADRGLLGTDLRADLALLELDERSYLARKLLLAAGTVVLAPLLLTALAAAAGVPWLAAAWLSVLLALAALVLPDRRVRAAASVRRRDFTASVSAYLDLVAMRAASGSGVPEALRQAAAVGTGTAFARIRRALQDAQLSGRTSGQCLTRLGAQLGVEELVQLGGQLQTISDAGAQAEGTLRAKAEALRARQLTEAQAAAAASSETMLVGSAFLLLGFLIVIGYPALSSVLQL